MSDPMVRFTGSFPIMQEECIFLGTLSPRLCPNGFVKSLGYSEDT